MRQIRVYVIDYYERYKFKRVYDKVMDARLCIEKEGIVPFIIFNGVDTREDFEQFIEVNNNYVNKLVRYNYIDEPQIKDENSQIRYLIVYEDYRNKRVISREIKSYVEIERAE